MLQGRRLAHMGIVVPDLEVAAAHYARLFGITEWRCWEYGPDTVASLTYRGAPGRFRIRNALSSVDPEIELIQPLEGPSIYEDWLAENVDGIHHLGVLVESFEEEAERMAQAGFRVTQSGFGYGLRREGGAFAYYDTAAAFGVCLELIERPSRRREPDGVFSFSV